MSLEDISKQLNQVVLNLGDLNTRLGGVEDSLTQQVDSVSKKVDKSEAHQESRLQHHFATLNDRIGQVESNVDSTSLTSQGKGNKDTQSKPGPTYAWLGRDGNLPFLNHYDTLSLQGGHNAQASAAEVQRSYEQVKDGLNKVKLPDELKIYHKQQGIKADCQQAYSVVSKCAGYNESTAKWIAEKTASLGEDGINLSSEDLQDLFTITYAQASYLRGEYASLLVRGMTDEATAKIFNLFERNPTYFSDQTMKHLTNAAELAEPSATTTWQSTFQQ
jgi:hypothetical protein